MITGHRLLGACPPVGLTVESDFDVDTVRRLAAAAAAAQGFDRTHAERASFVAAEMAANLARQGRAGRILVRLVEQGDLPGVDLVASDGPEAGNFARPASDGVSPDGAADVQLAVAARLSDLFDMYSVTGRGTVMMARLWGGRQTGACVSRYLVGCVVEAIRGEVVSGDAWAVERHGAGVVALVADGLGHGESAAEASEGAVRAFREHHQEPVEDIVAHIHRALEGTRGAAIAVAEIDPGAGRVRFCGIGNIYACLVAAGERRELVSQFGIAGFKARRIQAFEQAWVDGALLVMHSDGLSPRWDFDAYADLHRHHPQLAAATVMRDAPRANDDALVLTLRGTDGADAAARAIVREAG